VEKKEGTGVCSKVIAVVGTVENNIVGTLVGLFVGKLVAAKQNMKEKLHN